MALYRTVVEAVGRRAHIVAGTGTYDTAESIHLSGAGGGRRELTGSWRSPRITRSRPRRAWWRISAAIADATDLPVILYNIPGRTGRLIEISTLAVLAEHPRIVAVKDAVEDAQFTARTVFEVGDGMAVYSGQDSITLPLMTVGAVGVVSVASHLAGPQVSAMVEAAASGDFVEPVDSTPDCCRCSTRCSSSRTPSR